jgi:7,8-dihydropterin-6-yl-methyl-4-(beta-D-ribofuranosyl)aminobenzene 5'-phosphate synthase
MTSRQGDIFFELRSLSLRLLGLGDWAGRVFIGSFSQKLDSSIMKHAIFATGLAILLGLSPSGFAFGGNMQTGSRVFRLTVVFNNIPFDTRLTTSWGFSCLIRGTEQTILFDTGGDGKVLLSNMNLLGIDPKSIDTVFLSHIHGDHTGGLEEFLKQNPNINVCLLESFPDSFQHAITKYGARIKAVAHFTRLFDSVYSTGEMGDWIKEQALILATSNGLVIITGCAHPGVVSVVRQATERCNDNVYLVMGGFHLGGMTSAQIQGVIRGLKALGVKKVAPSHCTGERAINMLRDVRGEDFVEAGAGAIIETPQ